MASDNRKTTHDLELCEQLHDRPYVFGFFQALRRLECLYRNEPRIGHSFRPGDESLRLAQEPTMHFSPATLVSFDQDDETGMSRLVQSFFGLLGPNGPLPVHLTEYVRDRTRNHDDETTQRFLDLFHHRMLSFFYRAWAAAQPTASLDRPESDRFGVFMASLVGIGSPALRDRDAMPDYAKFHFAGHLACQTRHPDGLVAIISTVFGERAEIEEFVGQWIKLPIDAQGRLDRSFSNGLLGRNATIGKCVWDCNQRFRIVLGPLDFETYERFLPGGENLKMLTAIVRNYIGDELALEVNLILRKQQVPSARLGRSGRIGWTSWLGRRPPQKDPRDLVLRRYETNRN